jgi:hypothetical protein
MKHLIAAAEDAIRDQLLEAGILFDFRSGAVAGVGGVEKGLQVRLGVRLEPLKVSDLVEQQGRHDEDMFNILRCLLLGLLTHEWLLPK